MSADCQYYPDQMSTFPGPTSLLAATQMLYKCDYDPNNACADAHQQQQLQQTARLGTYNISMMMCSLPQTNTPIAIYNTSQCTTSLSSSNNSVTSASLLSDQTGVNQPYFGTHVAGVSSATALLDQKSIVAYYQDTPTSFHYSGGATANSGSGASSLIGMENFYQLAKVDASSAATTSETSGTDKAAEFDEGWQDYQRRLATVFKEITEGNLKRAADGLLSVSFWLLTRVGELGLIDEDETLQKDHLKLWQDFNHAWIGLIFKQKQYMQQASPENSVPQPLSLRMVKRMGDELISLCDSIERHGLVDYQLGVWEDEIEILLEDCLTLFEDAGEYARNEANRNGYSVYDEREREERKDGYQPPTKSLEDYISLFKNSG